MAQARARRRARDRCESQPSGSGRQLGASALACTGAGAGGDAQHDAGARRALANNFVLRSVLRLEHADRRPARAHRRLLRGVVFPSGSHLTGASPNTPAAAPQSHYAPVCAVAGGGQCSLACTASAPNPMRGAQPIIPRHPSRSAAPPSGRPYPPEQVTWNALRWLADAGDQPFLPASHTSAAHPVRCGNVPRLLRPLTGPGRITVATVAMRRSKTNVRRDLPRAGAGAGNTTRSPPN